LSPSVDNQILSKPLLGSVNEQRPRSSRNRTSITSSWLRRPPAAIGNMAAGHEEPMPEFDEEEPEVE
jgi:hypothetical protein